MSANLHSFELFRLHKRIIVIFASRHSIINLSTEQEVFGMTCNVLETKQFIATKFPSEKFLIIRIFLVVFNGILIIPTILLNAVALVTILKCSQLKSKPCYFVILLQSLIDLVVGALAIPLFIFFLAIGLGGASNCIAAILAIRTVLMPMALSAITLLAMTADRYIAILHPYAYSTLVTKKRMQKYVGSSAVVIFALVLLSLIIPRASEIAGAGVSTLILFFNVFAYIRIYGVVKRLARSAKQPQDSGAEENVSRTLGVRQEIRQAKSCFIVVFCYFALVFLPAASSAAVADLDKFDKLAYLSCTQTFALFNASVNSIVFFWAKTMLRKEAHKILKRFLQPLNKLNFCRKDEQRTDVQDIELNNLG